MLRAHSSLYPPGPITARMVKARTHDVWVEALGKVRTCTEKALGKHGHPVPRGRVEGTVLEQSVRRTDEVLPAGFGKQVIGVGGEDEKKGNCSSLGAHANTLDKVLSATSVRKRSNQAWKKGSFALESTPTHNYT